MLIIYFPGLIMKLNNIFSYLIKRVSLLLILYFLLSLYWTNLSNPLKRDHVRLYVYDTIKNPYTFYRYASLKLNKAESNSFIFNELIDYGISLCKVNKMDKSCIDEFLKLKELRKNN